MMRATLAFTAAALLAACIQNSTPIDGPDACGASGLQGIVGQDQSVLAAMTFPVERLRVIEPGMAVTTDHVPARLNIDLGTDGRIARVYCG
jgi:hypothetical protein